jgi:hypothetical protein
MSPPSEDGQPVKVTKGKAMFCVMLLNTSNITYRYEQQLDSLAADVGYLGLTAPAGRAKQLCQHDNIVL